ncbi:hypothetical protein COV19_02845 [Candidatus Woesearchaeota archaeon CG10_big_fil_rev_8_21_14_0_10_44_13]|nr:MAG: hypothetical protein COV19_02845 [Candidatus Woesearchaeota archaeon CG10_big_fil_rev_8_21_14_0_10_44_13]
MTAYAIGGTAMMFLGFKDTTLDIDLVFENEEDRDIFKEAIRSLGYQEMDGIKVYGVKRNKPEMFKLEDERFDLFVVQVIDFIFSNNMRKRAEQIRQFEDNLILKIADPHDIILMKCATDRVKDKDDARKIINSIKIDWNILIEESKHQIKLGKDRAVFDLGCFLEELKNKMKVDIPKEVLDRLFKMVEEQAKKKQKD